MSARRRQRDEFLFLLRGQLTRLRMELLKLALSNPIQCAQCQRQARSPLYLPAQR